uniref:Uncharacterized protein LOC104225489 n=1 Tax=Nicotiana sylvestris TaxID=4096 RepID=A0A1U7WAD2_NICSY|nr:PREDICTED: uncharacterized protein LOC104225489 [Nicotiana sylvestris]
MECIFLNGVLYWTDRYTCVAYFNFSKEKFGQILPPLPYPQCDFTGWSSIQTALWGKLAMYCLYRKRPVLLIYDDTNKVFIAAEKTTSINVPSVLIGGEKINNKTKGACVLATASVTSAPASVLSSSKPCCLKFASNFAEHNRSPSINLFVKLLVRDIMKRWQTTQFNQILYLSNDTALKQASLAYEGARLWFYHVLGSLNGGGLQ